jgi:hypothetical protein
MRKKRHLHRQTLPVLSSDEEQQMKKIDNKILLSRDSAEKKKGVKALSSYGKTIWLTL